MSLNWSPCGGVQDRLEKQAQGEVNRDRQRIEREVQKDQKLVEDQVDVGRVEKRVQEERQKDGGRQGFFSVSIREGRVLPVRYPGPSP